MEIFLSQVDKIIAEYGLSDDRDFDKQIGLANKLYRWREGHVKGMETETLLLISQKFNKSIDWLLTGEEPGTLEEHTNHFESRQPAPVDTELISLIVKNVEEYLNEIRLKISPSRKGKLVSMIYEYCITEKAKPDKAALKAYLALTH